MHGPLLPSMMYTRWGVGWKEETGQVPLGCFIPQCLLSIITPQACMRLPLLHVRYHSEHMHALVHVVFTTTWGGTSHDHLHQTCSRPTLCDPMDYSPPGSSVCGNFQARILEWVAISSSRRPSQPKDRAHISVISCLVTRLLCYCATQEALYFRHERIKKIICSLQASKRRSWISMQAAWLPHLCL